MLEGGSVGESLHEKMKAAMKNGTCRRQASSLPSCTVSALIPLALHLLPWEDAVKKVSPDATCYTLRPPELEE